MSNRTQMRERLRGVLGDTGAVRVWSDDLLDDLLVEASDWYSRLWPMQATAYRDAAAEQRTFDVPPGAFGVVQVECPPGQVLPREASGPTGSTGSTGRRQSWSLWGGVLYLGNPARGDQVGTGKLVMRVLLPWDRPDPVVDWGGPEEDERLLVLWAAALLVLAIVPRPGLSGRPSKAGPAAARYAEQLEREVNARKRAASSRRMDEG
jgi:hypothetical protein